MKYQEVVERDREELETLLRRGNKQDIQNALLSAAYYDPDWKWVQGQCLTFTYHSNRSVRSVAATCLGHIARLHWQLDLDSVLQRLTAMRIDPLIRTGVDDALEDIRFYAG